MQVRTRVILAILMIVLLTPFIQAEELLRDDWYILEQNGIPGGLGNDQMLKTEDGFHYRGFFQLNMDLLGTPFLVLEQTEAWVDEEFRLLKTLRVSDVDGVQTRQEAVFSYGSDLTEIHVTTIDTTGNTTSSYWSWEGLKPIYTSTSFVDKLLQEDALVVGAEFNFDSWNDGEVKSVLLKVEDEDTLTYNGSETRVVIATENLDNLQMKAHIDAQGHYYITEAIGQNLRILKVEEDALPELQTIAADVLMVPSNIVVQHPYRSTYSLITVDWLDVPMEDFSWEDNRQELVQVLGENAVQLMINRDTRDFTNLIQLPVQGEEFAPYLADTSFITPSSPRVQELVKEILDGETDAWKATELILDWVFNHITAKMVARTLTTEEILLLGEGKCAEYATLFAALARAAGLPTKVALGERYQGNIWVGHLWNEVWLGEWVAVDPSHNQVSPDALLIKFIDSDTLMGTQGVRVGLVNKLNITIEEVEIGQNENEFLLTTGLVDRRYQNAEYSCEITIPEGWMGLEDEEQGFPMLVTFEPSHPEFSVVLLMTSVPPGTKAEQLMASRIATLPSLLPNFELREQKTTLIAGQGAAVASWSFGDAPAFVQENRLLVRDDVAYLFVLTGPELTWHGYEDVIKEILDSFVTYR
ncbi:MAG: transglutaminase domain-containing protein [Firmicutes bacterium]|nr:transglutaminase domain-containing protein [Bacillota bacterium]